MKTSPRFSPATLSFLRRLKRNNRRDWFNARRDEYEAAVRQPMIAIRLCSISSNDWLSICARSRPSSS
jgi:uncharacterized protein (DUF2461 family)